MEPAFGIIHFVNEANKILRFTQLDILNGNLYYVNANRSSHDSLRYDTSLFEIMKLLKKNKFYNRLSSAFVIRFM